MQFSVVVSGTTVGEPAGWSEGAGIACSKCRKAFEQSDRKKISSTRSCILWNYPPTSNSHHEDCSIFSRESQPKPSFVTIASWVGGRPNAYCMKPVITCMQIKTPQQVGTFRSVLSTVNYLKIFPVNFKPST